ncbi:MAG TPA: hypothetical protein DFR83_04005 [Deltaproteobacteria bacterium]|nr:hypothetical protein [Deltaproteobacteria bacterium]
MIHGVDGLRGVEGVQLPLDEASKVFARALEHSGLGEVPVHIALGFALRAIGSRPVPASWEAAWSSLSEGIRNTAQLTNPLQALPEVFEQAALDEPSALLHPEGPAMFGLSADLAEDLVPQLLDAVSGSDHQEMEPRALIAALITQAADESLTSSTRTAWSLALDVLAYRAHHAGDAGLARSARHTSLAIRSGYYGSEVPFVRIWLERALRTLVESARAVSGPGPVGPRIAAARAALDVEPGEA